MRSRRFADPGGTHKSIDSAVRSLMPLGQMTTTLEFDPDKKQVILHGANTVEDINADKACRTKLAAKPLGDIAKLLNYGDTRGWHGVAFYEDLQRPVEHMAAFLGFEVVHEAKPPKISPVIERLPGQSGGWRR